MATILKRDYTRIRNRLKELGELYLKSLDSKYLKEDYCICCLFEAEGFQTYERITSFCLKHNINRVVDIGCAYGHQSEVFLQNSIDYIGINENECNFWNKDKFQYIVDSYPCKIPVQKGDLGVSVLCLTWNCYLHEGKKTLHEQCQALQRDFTHCLLYLQIDHIEVVKSYFKKYEQIDGNLFYFSN